MLKLFLSFFLSFISAIAFAANKPTVYLLATGGTIAGTASSQTSATYKAGSLTVEQIIASVPGIDNLANIKYEQVYNKDSGNVTLSDWLKLANQVNKVINDPSVNAVVITHGTDTMEETAYFLDLVIKTKKPIIIVGSMRPATAISADGPLNLYNAVSVAASPKSIGRGVMVVMNDGIYDARNVTKTNTMSVETFQSPNTGPVGHVVMGKVSYNEKLYPLAYDAPFDISNIKSLPSVAIIYENVGVDTEMLDNILKTKNLKGIVIAGVGDGNIPDYEKNFLINARKKGIVIVRSSRVGSGEVTYDYNNLDTTYDLIAGDNLNPQKARILLMLSLLTTSDVKQIQKNFYTY